MFFMVVGVQARFLEILKAKLARDRYLQSICCNDADGSAKPGTRKLNVSCFFQRQGLKSSPKQWILLPESQAESRTRANIKMALRFALRVGTPRALLQLLKFKEEWIPGFHMDPQGVERALPFPIKQKQLHELESDMEE